MLHTLQPLIHFASAQTESVCKGVAATGGSCTGNANSLMDGFQKITNTLVFLVGAISVIMVIIGALRYVLSNGDAAGLKSAKDTILYALIGVVVSLLAYALVSFVIHQFS